MKDKLQGKIRAEGDRRWSEHTRVLPELKVEDFVQIQNIKGTNTLKIDYNGEIVGKHNVNSYAKLMGRIGLQSEIGLVLGKFHPLFLSRFQTSPVGRVLS